MIDLADMKECLRSVPGITADEAELLWDEIHDRLTRAEKRARPLWTATHRRAARRRRMQRARKRARGLVEGER